jgi:signal transduction histidine kinase
MPLPPEAQQRQLEIIRRTAQRMDRLIQDLLDVSRMEAGRFSVEQFPESVRSLIGETRELLGSIASQQGLSLVDDLPDYDVRVRADRARVLQVFSNLVGNAVKFTPAGGTVTISASVQQSAVKFEVSDTGVGIAEENLPHIFDRFWHSGHTTGSGLGLAIAKGIVEAHGGRIWARSSDRGSTFAFTLPLATEPARQPA